MSSQEDIRQVAIDHHHIAANIFEHWYSDLAQSRFSNAFTYGRSKIDRMVDQLFRSIGPGGKVLDVGCGTGEHLKRATEQGLKAYGVEPAPAMLEAAQENVPEAVVKRGIATRLPFDDAEFDALIMIEVLRYLHTTDVQQALSEARRVLRPGGTILVTLVNRWSLDGFYIFQRARQLLTRDKYNNKHPYCLFFSPREAERELRRAGFANVRTEGRLLGPLRLAYRLNESAGRTLASKLERFDDRVHRSTWARGLAGHLIALGQAPGESTNRQR